MKAGAVGGWRSHRNACPRVAARSGLGIACESATHARPVPKQFAAGPAFSLSVLFLTSEVFNDDECIHGYAGLAHNAPAALPGAWRILPACPPFLCGRAA